jgi:hypothetical protein
LRNSASIAVNRPLIEIEFCVARRISNPQDE